MKKTIVWLLAVLFLLVTFACDASGDGCEEDVFVPTCGEGVIGANDIIHESTELFVNWNGPGAPIAPSNTPGFGENGQPNPLNAYSWSMESFGGHLYVGVYNRLYDTSSETGDVCEGGEVWRYESGPMVNSGSWKQEVVAGFGNLTNQGIRIMKVYNNHLFAGTHNPKQGTELWRRSLDTASCSGQWEAISVAGFGDSKNKASRSMALFNGKLYIGTDNRKTGAKLYKFDADTQALSLIERIGSSSGRQKANVISELLSFGDHLWIFTWGGTAGLRVFRMDQQENIEYAGNVGMDINNTGIMSSAIFNGKIYVGTVNLVNAVQLFAMENPNAANPQDVNFKRVGANVFQPTENYIWRMQVFSGQLYMGTLNPSDKSENTLGATLYRMDKNEEFCQVIGDGRLIEEGFGQSENFGIRSMTEHNGRLYIGTAQKFQVEPGSVDSDAGNREGTEVWEFDKMGVDSF